MLTFTRLYACDIKPKIIIQKIEIKIILKNIQNLFAPIVTNGTYISSELVPP